MNSFLSPSLQLNLLTEHIVQSVKYHEQTYLKQSSLEHNQPQGPFDKNANEINLLDKTTAEIASSKIAKPETSLSSVSSSEIKNVVIAFSGGVDSSVLLHLCAQIKKDDSQWQRKSVHAIHINHGISEHSDAWQLACEKMSERLGVSFKAIKLSLPKLSRTSLEAQARDARYSAINEYVLNCFGKDAIILLGQHQDDQAETLLLQLKRGSGVQGLGAMPKHFESDKGLQFCRPLLDVSQNEIVDFATQQNLDWVEDESNQNLRFDRNFLRHDIMPVLKSRWPSISQTIARSASLCRQQSQLVKEYANLSLDKLLRESDPQKQLSPYCKSALDIDLLLLLSEALRAEVLRVWIGQQGLHALSLSQLQQVENMLACANDAQASMTVQGHCIEAHNRHLVIFSKEHLEQHFDLHGRDNIALPVTVSHPVFGFKINVINACALIDIRFKVEFGDLSARLKAFENRPAKKLKAWYKSFSVPPAFRSIVPVISANDSIVAVVLADQVLINVEHPMHKHIEVECLVSSDF